MKIKSIELNKYKRFSLNQIDHFKLTATEKTQIILGTNGSGKSSFLSEVSPLPAISTNFHKGGGKTVHILANGSSYKLSSIFGNGKEHSFIKDDQPDLNPGGTITVQRALVEQEFGITQDIHELMIGVEKFSLMSPARRREWFTRLCDVDYTYALKTYNKARERHRDLQGAAKLAKKRLVQEQSKACSAQEVSELTVRINATADEITKLYRVRSADDKTASQIQSSIRSLSSEVSVNFQKFKELKKNRPWVDFIDPDEMREDLGQRKGRSIAISERVQFLTVEHEKLDQQLKIFNESGNQNLSELEDRKKNHQKEIDDLVAQLQLVKEVQDPIACRSALMSIYDVLNEVFCQLPVNADKKHNPQLVSELETKLIKARDELVVIESKIQKVQHECEHMQQLLTNGSIDCPKCNHSFSPGYSEKKHRSYQEFLTKGNEVRQQKKDIISNLSQELEAAKNYLEIFRQYSRSVNALPILQPLWRILSSDNLIFESPSLCATKMVQFDEDLVKLIKIEEIKKNLLSLDDLIILAKRSSQVDVENVVKESTAIEEELGRLANEQSSLQKQITSIQNDINAGVRFLEMEKMFTDYANHGVSLNIQLLDNFINEEIDRQIREKQIVVAQWQYQLNTAKEHESVIASIEKEVKNLESQEAAMKLVVECLSPTEGLIAEGLFGFMRNFVKKMNIVIGSVWTYFMEVQTCSLGDDGATDLDYKFPVLIQGEDSNQFTTVADVSKGSSGMREIIDLAFKIVAMHYLKLNNAPLELDEFGITLDVQHRINATQTIKKLLEQMSFSQLWLVSHYEESYMCFTNAEVCVLSSNNIVTPTKDSYNLHVEMA